MQTNQSASISTAIDLINSASKTELQNWSTKLGQAFQRLQDLDIIYPPTRLATDRGDLPSPLQDHDCKVAEHLPVYSCYVSPASSRLLAGSARAREHVFA
jgi:hypothetical protein